MLPHSKSQAYHQELMSRYAAEANRRKARDDRFDGVARLVAAMGQGLLSIGKSLRRSLRERTA